MSLRVNHLRNFFLCLASYSRDYYGTTFSNYFLTRCCRWILGQTWNSCDFRSTRISYPTVPLCCGKLLPVSSTNPGFKTGLVAHMRVRLSKTTRACQAFVRLNRFAGAEHGCRGETGCKHCHVSLTACAQAHVFFENPSLTHNRVLMRLILRPRTVQSATKTIIESARFVCRTMPWEAHAVDSVPLPLLMSLLLLQQFARYSALEQHSTLLLCIDLLIEFCQVNNNRFCQVNNNRWRHPVKAFETN